MSYYRFSKGICLPICKYCINKNWLIGHRIAEEELKGNNRADYGVEVIKKLSKKLTEKYGKGFDRSNLYRLVSFYKNFPRNCRHTGISLSWSHYRILLQVLNKEAREWYEKEALEQMWSTRTLQRNIETQYYYRLLKLQAKELVINERKNNIKQYELLKKLEFLKNPVIAEFLGYSDE